MDFGFRISDCGFATHPLVGFFNAKATRPSKGETADHADRRRFFDADCDNLLHRQARATHPPGFLTQRRGDAESSSRSLIVRRGPGRQTARDRLSPSFYNQVGLAFPSHKKVRARRNRHAVGVSAGGATMRDERSRSKRTVASPVAGDREIAGDSAGHSRLNPSSLAMNSLCLCVFVFATWVGGLPSVSIWVICGLLALGGRSALRLCVFAPLRFFLSVSLWLSSSGRRISRLA